MDCFSKRTLSPGVPQKRVMRKKYGGNALDVQFWRNGQIEGKTNALSVRFWRIGHSGHQTQEPNPGASERQSIQKLRSPTQ